MLLFKLFLLVFVTINWYLCTWYPLPSPYINFSSPLFLQHGLNDYFSHYTNNFISLRRTLVSRCTEDCLRICYRMLALLYTHYSITLSFTLNHSCHFIHNFTIFSIYLLNFNFFNYTIFFT